MNELASNEMNVCADSTELAAVRKVRGENGECTIVQTAQDGGRTTVVRVVRRLVVLVGSTPSLSFVWRDAAVDGGGTVGIPSGVVLIEGGEEGENELLVRVVLIVEEEEKEGNVLNGTRHGDGGGLLIIYTIFNNSNRDWLYTIHKY